MNEQVKPENDYDELAKPPRLDAPKDHPLWPSMVAAMREVYDPEIPVNMYELGLIYRVEIKDREDGKSDVFIDMSLTSPGCPLAQEIPIWIQGAILPLEGVGDVEVELVWEPPWDPSFMAETAKMELNMFA